MKNQKHSKLRQKGKGKPMRDFLAAVLRFLSLFEMERVESGSQQDWENRQW